MCDPEKENLCLYGFPNETWDVALPDEILPPELPEPTLGINFAREGIDEKDWLSLVAVHSDAWLLAVAFYLGARIGFDKEGRKRLFQMINGLPTILEVVSGAADRKQAEEKMPNSISKSNKSSSKPSRQSEMKSSKVAPPPSEEDDDEHGNTMCSACGGNYSTDEFWICCSVCERWFHGKCVRISPARAEHIKQYKCPACSSTKRARA
ncbi:PHD finger protein ALFIN-LIKE 8-like isoform X3 [Iris pallida]|uniref:PHD finger protein ALFIN-LIKE n=1 Tax=Iris pallida TaxID=29817 RepID=A0AAX6HLN5_IRIPA|nr:PHD finger protein ALFIN-LIKE 8-like isoform X3 [Iris pallida]